MMVTFVIDRPKNKDHKRCTVVPCFSAGFRQVDLLQGKKIEETAVQMLCNPSFLLRIYAVCYTQFVDRK